VSGRSAWLTASPNHLTRRLEARTKAGQLLISDELPEFTCWVAWTATPAGQALGASEVRDGLLRRTNELLRSYLKTWCSDGRPPRGLDVDVR
jgi:hypothetical protein